MVSDKKKALVIGVTGQDGCYLADHLLKCCYCVIGSSRDKYNANLAGLRRLGIYEQIELISSNPNDFYDVLKTLDRIRPNEIYLLASQSSVGLSFVQPYYTIESSTIAVLNVLEAMRYLGLSSRLYYASSGEIFGGCSGPITEQSPIRPLSPYGVAKASASQIVRVYRESYGLYAVNGFLFNHESPLRGDRFVTKKIIRAAYDIRHGKSGEIRLGNVDIQRDWGWAPEYVVAMNLMLQLDEPTDFIIGTGTSTSLREFIDHAFSYYGLNYKDYLIQDQSEMRPNELMWSGCDPSKAQILLGWSAKYIMPDVVRLMSNAISNL